MTTRFLIRALSVITLAIFFTIAVGTHASRDGGRLLIAEPRLCPNISIRTAAHFTPLACRLASRDNRCHRNDVTLNELRREKYCFRITRSRGRIRAPKATRNAIGAVLSGSFRPSERLMEAPSHLMQPSHFGAAKLERPEST